VNGERGLEFAAAIAAAAVVAAGVLFFGWPTFTVLALYWIGNVVIGVFTLLRIAIASARAGHPFGGVFVGAFFAVHYGLFCLGHAFLIATLLGRGGIDGSLLFKPAALLVARVASDSIGTIALLAITLGAGFDALRRLRNADAADRADPRGVMSAPYGRIVVLHVVLLVGGFLLQLLQAPAVAALLLVGAKLASDMIWLRRPPVAVAETAG
jgi:hypothetical protein